MGILLERILESCFRKKCSTISVNVIDVKLIFSASSHRLNITNRRDIKKSICLDFQKAFDSVWLKGLLFRLYEIGVPTQMLHPILLVSLWKSYRNLNLPQTNISMINFNFQMSVCWTGCSYFNNYADKNSMSIHCRLGSRVWLLWWNQYDDK